DLIVTGVQTCALPIWPVDIDVVPELDRIGRHEPTLVREVVRDLNAVAGSDLPPVPVGDDHQHLGVGIPTREVAAGPGDGGAEGGSEERRGGKGVRGGE